MHTATAHTQHTAAAHALHTAAAHAKHTAVAHAKHGREYNIEISTKFIFEMTLNLQYA
jgi:hypothetical protein